MTTKRKSSVQLGLIALLLASSFAACGTVLAGPLDHALSEGPARPMRMFFSGQFGRLLALRSELDLTTEQRQQVRTILQSHRQEIATVSQPVVEKRRALREATIAADADEAAIRAAAAELGKAIGDAAVVGSQVKAEVRTVLTPDQRKKVNEFRVDSESAVDDFLKNAAN